METNCQVAELVIIMVTSQVAETLVVSATFTRITKPRLKWTGKTWRARQTRLKTLRIRSLSVFSTKPKLGRRFVFLDQFRNLATGRNSSTTWNGPKATCGRAALHYPLIPSISSTSTHSCKIKEPGKSIGKKVLTDWPILNWCRIFRIKSRWWWETIHHYQELTLFM